MDDLKIIYNVRYIYEELNRKLEETKTPSKKLLKATRIAFSLCQKVFEYTHGTIQEVEKIVFLINVGILTEIFLRIPKSGKIQEKIQEVINDLACIKIDL